MQPGATQPEPSSFEEFNLRFSTLSKRKPSVKEIESSVPGEPSFTVERTLPSFFDCYPRAKKAAEAQVKP